MTIYSRPHAEIGVPGGSRDNESACNAGDQRSSRRSGRSRGGAHGNPLRYSCLENLMDRGAWRATVHGVLESATTEQRTLSYAEIREMKAGS